MSKILDLPLLHDLIPGGVEYGSIVLVEFETQSCWFDVAYTLAAQALRSGAKVDLHVFQQHPKAAQAHLAEMGFDLRRLQEEDRLRFIDSYTVQVGVGTADSPGDLDIARTQSIRMDDWARASVAALQGPVPEPDRHRFHIDDNAAVVTRYNTEDATIEAWRTRLVPLFKARETTLINAVAIEFASPAFYRQLESMSEGILDLRAEEGAGGIEQLFRVRSFRGRSPDSRWQSVHVSGREASLTPRGRGLTTRSGSTSVAGGAEGAVVGSVRGLAAIVFADMVGSTRLSGVNEELALRLRDEQREILRGPVANFDGRVVKTMGDGTLLAFASVLGAARWALEVQSALALRNRRCPPSEAIHLRIGIHVGEVLVEGADISGHEVDVASRIEPLAAPGGVCLSRAAYDQVRKAPELRFESLGVRELKGVEPPSEVLKLLTGAEG